MLTLALAGLHLLALGLGLGAVLGRAGALREPASAAALGRAFRADAMWGIAAGLWLATGLWRLFGETEKATGYYYRNHVFLAKMGLFLLILALEVWPMVTLIRWRVALGRGAGAESVAAAGTARRIAAISYAQAALVVAMVFAAVAMARGVGARG
jgi:putative membrane protein